MRPRIPFGHRSSLLVLVVLSLVVAGCSDEPGVDSAPTASDVAASADVSAAPSTGEASASAGEAIDPDVDACALIDVATVQVLTGASVEYATDSTREASGSSCFWGATTPNEPGYVELMIFRQTSLSAYSFGEGCDVTPVGTVGEEASYVVCPPDPQTKISLLAYERGVIVSLLVNEAGSGVAPEELASVVSDVLARLD